TVSRPSPEPKTEHDDQHACERVPGDCILQVLVAQLRSHVHWHWQPFRWLRRFHFNEKRRDQTPSFGGCHGNVVAYEPEISCRVVARCEKAAPLRPAHDTRDITCAGDLAGLLAVFRNETAVHDDASSTANSGWGKYPITIDARVFTRECRAGIDKRVRTGNEC